MLRIGVLGALDAIHRGERHGRGSGSRRPSPAQRARAAAGGPGPGRLGRSAGGRPVERRATAAGDRRAAGVRLASAACPGAAAGAPHSPAVVLVSEPPGYAVRLPVAAVDAWLFESLVRQAGDDDRSENARALSQRGARICGGDRRTASSPPNHGRSPRRPGWTGCAPSPRSAGVRPSCAPGDANEAVMAAEPLTREHPLREEGWRLLAMGLYAEGRQADALTALRRARDILADELGMDPGPALLQVETDVLAQRLAVPVARSAAARTGPRRPVGSTARWTPRQRQVRRSPVPRPRQAQPTTTTAASAAFGHAAAPAAAPPTPSRTPLRRSSAGTTNSTPCIRWRPRPPTIRSAGRADRR